eukprot:TRINITY_DN3134_c0_g1_i1.p1 TRINITY_DN3134_c0_g1~~TRINITY_DN3134_c0_g1_i1.p1  ORF type:complete len:212 (-),score=25.60 TRINITY_DN3134_c0_g1_i1:135-770(-)
MPRTSLLLLLHVELLVVGTSFEYTGYVVDKYCWDRPGHRGIDGSQLGTNPGSHILHCLWEVPVCRDLGYVMLEELSSPAADGSTYALKYTLDDSGDDLVFQLSKAEQARGGDRPFNEQVTVTGTLTNNEIAVTRICITPQASNPSGDTICHPPNSSSNDTTTRPVLSAGSSDTTTRSTLISAALVAGPVWQVLTFCMSGLVFTMQAQSGKS